MSVPIKQADGEVYMNLQVVAKLKKNSKFYQGFSAIDEHFL